MNKRILSALAMSVPAAAQAHTGHLAEIAGHSHWVAGAALGVAIALGIWSTVKGSAKAKGEADQTPDSAASQDA